MWDSIKRTLDSEYSRLGYDIHHWQHGDADILVLQKEPFRIQWFATQLVTFVFLIPRTVERYDDILDDYRSLRGYAGEHKRTWLPMGIQCGYALLPVYLGAGFSDSLKAATRSTFKKHWCVSHVPSLWDLNAREVTTLAAKSFWGCIYRPFISKTISEVVGVIAARAPGPDTTQHAGPR
jgi:hypothetical protein